MATGDRALGLAPRAYLQLSGGHHQVYTVHVSMTLNMSVSVSVVSMAL